MMKRIIALSIFLFITVSSLGQNLVDGWIVEDGGAGTHKAMITLYEEIPGCVIYRPISISSAVSKTTLPIVLFRPDQEHSAGFERFLTEIASFGYIVIAEGSYRYENDELRVLVPSDGSFLKDAMDILRSYSEKKGNVFSGSLDFTNIAYISRFPDESTPLYPQADTYIYLDASASALRNPALYVVGSKDEIKYKKALSDLEHSGKTFTALASLPIGGEGTYAESYGGSYSTIVLQWLEWQLKGKNWSRKIFTGEECICMYSGWEIEYRNENHIIN